MRPARGGRVVSSRGHRVRRNRATTMNVRRRTRVALSTLLILLVAALVKLVFIQGVDAQALAAKGADQGGGYDTLPATRGAITDRNGTQLAYTIQGRAIAARPALFVDDTPLTAKDKPLKSTGHYRQILTGAQKRAKVVDILVAALGGQVDRTTLTTQLTPFRKNPHPYVYLATNLMPAQADAIMDKIDAQWDAEDVDGDQREMVTTERQDIRQNPDAGVAAAVVGTTGWGGIGRSGIESKFNSVLTGTPGSRSYQQDAQGRPIPNTETDVVPAVNGTDIRLTLDADLQFQVQQLLASQVDRSQAKGGCAVVKGISDGQIYALACYQPGKTALQTGNPAVTTSFEPGSVNKVVTFAAAIQANLITPSTTFTVPGAYTADGSGIKDAWSHDPVQMSAAGILGKSSNVGTLIIAHEVGQEPFAQELTKFGIGRKTGIELPGEDSGSFPPVKDWSATSFDNLPIGQGVRMTLIQLVDMYQAIGNGGVMVSPTIIAGTGTGVGYRPAAAPAGTRVLAPTTASTLLHFLGAPIQCKDQTHDSWTYQGTGCKAALTGYLVAGKTGTAQQVDPATKRYSDTKVNATFAGIVPADHPKYAIAIMIDDPAAGSEGGENAAPLFHDIAAYALRAANVAPSSGSPTAFPLFLSK